MVHGTHNAQEDSRNDTILISINDEFFPRNEEIGITVMGIVQSRRAGLKTRFCEKFGLLAVVDIVDARHRLMGCGHRLNAPLSADTGTDESPRQG